MKFPEQFYIAISAAIEAGYAVMEIFEGGNFGTKLKQDNSPVTIADLKSSEIICDVLAATKISILSEEGNVDSFKKRKNWSLFWIVDPLDGTKEFVKRTNEFAINIGLVENEIAKFGVIYIPTTKEIFFGGKEYGSFKFEYDEKKGLSTQIDDTHPLAIPLKNKETLIITGGEKVKDEFFVDSQVLKTYSFKKMKFQKLSSSIKFCRIAEGKMDIYPRDYPCMEWDTAAGQAILNGIGKDIFDIKTEKSMRYNKESLYVPYFIAG